MKHKKIVLVAMAALLAVAVWGASAFTQGDGSQRALAVDRATVEKLIASIRGNTVIVDWHGTWDYSTIQEALDASSNGDTIIVLPSEGSPDGAYEENVEFPAKAITLRSINPDDAETVAATVIDGRFQGPVVTFAWGATGAAVLDGVTIQRGSADWGGGITCDGASPTIRNCVITSNRANWDGAGVYFGWACAATITDCAITGNTAEGYGGGMYCSSDDVPTITGCIFDGNRLSCGV